MKAVESREAGASIAWVKITGKECCLVEVASLSVFGKGSLLYWPPDRR